MMGKEDVTKKQLGDEEASQVFGGVNIQQQTLDKFSIPQNPQVAGLAFKKECSLCHKNINYATHRWGKEQKGNAIFVKGYFCDDCVNKFRKGEINDKNILEKFKQLDNRGDPNRYAPINSIITNEN